MKKHKVPPPPRGTRYLNKAEVLDRVGVTYPTLWRWMREKHFPRSRNLGNPNNLKNTRVGWLESEVETWLNARPVQTLKGDNKKRNRVVP